MGLLQIAHHWHNTCSTSPIVFNIYNVYKNSDTNFCGVAIYGQFLSALNTDKMTADLNKELNLPEHTSVQLQDFYSDSTDVMVEANLNQKFNTYVYALEFHLLLSNAENTKTLHR